MFPHLEAIMKCSHVVGHQFGENKRVEKVRCYEIGVRRKRRFISLFLKLRGSLRQADIFHRSSFPTKPSKETNFVNNSKEEHLLW